MPDTPAPQPPAGYASWLDYRVSWDSFQKPDGYAAAETELAALRARLAAHERAVGVMRKALGGMAADGCLLYVPDSGYCPLHEKDTYAWCEPCRARVALDAADQILGDGGGGVPGEKPGRDSQPKGEARSPAAAVPDSSTARSSAMTARDCAEHQGEPASTEAACSGTVPNDGRAGDHPQPSPVESRAPFPPWFSPVLKQPEGYETWLDAFLDGRKLREAEEQSYYNACAELESLLRYARLAHARIVELEGRLNVRGQEGSWGTGARSAGMARVDAGGAGPADEGEAVCGLPLGDGTPDAIHRHAGEVGRGVRPEHGLASRAEAAAATEPVESDVCECGHRRLAHGTRSCFGVNSEASPECPCSGFRPARVGAACPEWYCPGCEVLGCDIDEDGCCATCGCDAARVSAFLEAIHGAVTVPPKIRHLTEEQMAQMDCPFGEEKDWPEPGVAQAREEKPGLGFLEDEPDLYTAEDGKPYEEGEACEGSSAESSDTGGVSTTEPKPTAGRSPTTPSDGPQGQDQRGGAGDAEGCFPRPDHEEAPCEGLSAGSGDTATSRTAATAAGTVTDAGSTTTDDPAPDEAVRRWRELSLRVVNCAREAWCDCPRNPAGKESWNKLYCEDVVDAIEQATKELREELARVNELRRVSFHSYCELQVERDALREDVADARRKEDDARFLSAERLKRAEQAEADRAMLTGMLQHSQAERDALRADITRMQRVVDAADEYLGSYKWHDLKRYGQPDTGPMLAALKALDDDATAQGRVSDA